MKHVSAANRYETLYAFKNNEINLFANWPYWFLVFFHHGLKASLRFFNHTKNRFKFHFLLKIINHFKLIIATQRTWFRSRFTANHKFHHIKNKNHYVCKLNINIGKDTNEEKEREKRRAKTWILIMWRYVLLVVFKPSFSGFFVQKFWTVLR